MAECKNSTVRVLTVAYNGVNYDPIDKSVTIKMGGPIAQKPHMTAGGKAYPPIEMQGGEVEFEIPWTKEFNPESLRNTCGDLQILTDGYISFVLTNAFITSNIELSGEGKIKLTFGSDVTLSN